MELCPIEPINDDEDCPTNSRICCPECGLVWVTIEDDSADLVSADQCDCPHLRFILIQDGDGMDFYNGFSATTLQTIVEPAARQLSPDLDGESWTEFLGGNQFDDDLWARVESVELTHLFNHTQEGMACGPVSHTVLFGARIPQKTTHPNA
jgi:hypothetical protein